jgi:NADH-quinone oxidoreductase subunit J
VTPEALWSGGFGMLASASVIDSITFSLAATIIIVGALGVVLSRNPVHAALMLVMTLFGVAVLFVEQGAHFLAAVQIIVYAGAIVVLFLFVIMFLGVDRRENLTEEPLRGQRPVALLLVALGLAGLLVLGFGGRWAVGAHSVVGPARNQRGGDVAALGRAVFTTYLFPFEITAALLVIAVVGAVVLSRTPNAPQDSSAGPDAPTPGSAVRGGPGTGGELIGDRAAGSEDDKEQNLEAAPAAGQPAGTSHSEGSST